MKARLTVVLSVVACSLVLGSVSAVSAAEPYCGITWGSLGKTAGDMTRGPVVNARVGRQDCYDRFVVDLGSMPAPGYFVNYTDGFHTDGEGRLIPLAGGAVLTVVAQAPAYDANYQTTVPWAVGAHIVTPKQFTAGGFRTFRDLAYGGSFEGNSRFGLGLRARLPFRVFKLDGPGAGSRLVVDVAHQW